MRQCGRTESLQNPECILTFTQSGGYTVIKMVGKEAQQMENKYYLLNKDELIALFHIETVLQAIVIDQKFVTLPEWFGDLGTFISERRAPKHRENMKELLKLGGCDTLKGFLEVSHALSLVDTFWVKPVESTLSWEDVSLYSHPFNEVIARTAFEGGLHGRQFSTTSPEYGTDGSFAKCWIREDGIIKLLKRGSSGARNAGLEPYSEYYASQLVKEFTENCVSYDVRTYENRLCSVCDIFTSESFGFLPYAAVDRGNSTILSVLDKMEKMGFEEEARLMFVVDAVIMNEDRHKNNFGFIVNNETQVIEGMAPLFDHNISLLPYAEEEDFAGIDSYLQEKGPRLGEDWMSVARYCLDSKTRRILINLCDFRFERHKKYNLPEWRLTALEELIRRNIQRILG